MWAAARVAEARRSALVTNSRTCRRRCRGRSAGRRCGLWGARCASRAAPAFGCTRRTCGCGVTSGTWFNKSWRGELRAQADRDPKVRYFGCRVTAVADEGVHPGQPRVEVDWLPVTEVLPPSSPPRPPQPAAPAQPAGRWDGRHRDVATEPARRVAGAWVAGSGRAGRDTCPAFRSGGAAPGIGRGLAECGPGAGGGQAGVLNATRGSPARGLGGG